MRKEAEMPRRLLPPFGSKHWPDIVFGKYGERFGKEGLRIPGRTVELAACRCQWHLEDGLRWGHSIQLTAAACYLQGIMDAAESFGSAPKS